MDLKKNNKKNHFICAINKPPELKYRLLIALFSLEVKSMQIADI